MAKGRVNWWGSVGDGVRAVERDPLFFKKERGQFLWLGDWDDSADGGL
jgi:hypothetical protein